MEETDKYSAIEVNISNTDENKFERMLKMNWAVNEDVFTFRLTKIKISENI